MQTRFVAVGILLQALAGVAPAKVEAQDSIHLALGDRARITVHSQNARNKTYTGEVVGVSRDYIMLGPRRQVFPLNEVVQVEVPSGKHRRPMTGLLVGALTGTGAGVALGGAAGSSGSSDVAGQAVLAGGVGGALVGAAAGALIGSLKIYTRWAVVR